jgi:RimJ/RimL family protein N-acetyltransferase
MELQLTPRVRQRRAAAEPLLRTHTGRLFRVREGVPSDLPLLDAFAAQLSSETRRLRWFVPIPPEAIAQLWRQMLLSDPPQVAVVAETPGIQPSLIGVAQLAISPTQPDSAEIAIVVRDDYQRDGVGGRLSEFIARIGEARGLRQLTATILSDNRAITPLLRTLGVVYRTSERNGETQLTIERGAADIR